MYLNEATLLNNVKRRYMKDKIYVSVINGSPPNHLTYACQSMVPMMNWLKVVESLPLWFGIPASLTRNPCLSDSESLPLWLGIPASLTLQLIILLYSYLMCEIACHCTDWWGLWFHLPPLQPGVVFWLVWVLLIAQYLSVFVIRIVFLFCSDVKYREG